MGIQIAKPSSQLAPYVKQYWALESHISKTETFQQRIIPNGLMELSFHFDELPKTKQAGRDTNSRSVISGQQTSFFDIEITGSTRMFSVSLKPQGAMVLFDLSFQDLKNHSVSLHNILKNTTNQLEDQLFQASHFHEQIYIMETFFLKRLQKNSPKHDFQRINSSIKSINLNPENAKVEQLASEICLSRKQFERVFTDSIGLPPKQFLNVVRFQNAIHHKITTPKKTLTELAYDTGYYDQAHMINDFKKLSGLTPRQFFLSPGYSDYFAE